MISKEISLKNVLNSIKKVVFNRLKNEGKTNKAS